MDVAKQQDQLRERGFIIITEDDLSLPLLRERVAAAFFNEVALPPVPDTAGPVKTRYRNKDIIRYRWAGNELLLRGISSAEFARIGLGAHVRTVPWFSWLSIPGGFELVTALLSMVPPEWRHSSGTFGMHCFRSFDSVVDGPHVDGFEFGGVFVVEHTTGGAVSYIHDIATGTQLLSHQLQPGEIMLFHERFPGTLPIVTHGATELEPGGRRDAIILQIDSPEDLEAVAAEDAAT